MKTNEQPYITTKKKIIEETHEYNPKYGDRRVCECGHAYYRHFDSYEDMDPVGCKYCECNDFKEDDGTKITVLFPGGFKPLHQGHIDLIRQYSRLNKVSEVKLLVGSKERDGITQNLAIKIINIFFSDNDKITVEAPEWPTPVLAAFKEVELANDKSFTMATSNKDKDYERAHDFIIKHQEGKKYHDKLGHNVRVVDLALNTLDIFPSNYQLRHDEYDGTPISGTVLRQDVLNKDFKKFKTNYPYQNIDDIIEVWTELQINRTEKNSQELFEEMIKSWESLPGGRRHSSDVMARWLLNDMKPMIDKIRKVFKK